MVLFQKNMIELKKDAFQYAQYIHSGIENVLIFHTSLLHARL